MSKTRDYAGILGQGLFLSSISFSIGSVAMSSTFSVINFSTDEVTLQNAANALAQYVLLSVIWTVATMLVMYSQHSWCGALIGFLCNLVITGWIVGMYVHAFRIASRKNNIPFPKLFWW
jgi:hypothetical protein